MVNKLGLKIIALVDIFACSLIIFIIMALRSDASVTAEINVKTAGEYLIQVNWDKESEDDVDTYMMDPDNKVSYFANREVGLMHLERDDLGKSNDTITTEQGYTVIVEINEERMVLRGIAPGEYIVNVHMYRKIDALPTKVTTNLFRLKEGQQNEPVTESEVVLEKNGDEKTAFRFTLASDGEVTKVSRLFRSLMAEAAAEGNDDFPN